MPDGLGLFVKDWGAEGLLGFLILCIIIGRLVPLSSVNKTVELLEKQKDEAIERERYQRQSVENLLHTVRVQQEQLEALMEIGYTTLDVLNAARAPAASAVGRHHDG